MPESFGARLRRRREEQHIALSTIAGQTKIKLSLLEALERDDVSQWPSGIFRRAYIRAYAHAIGLSPDVVVREFLEVHPDPPELLATIVDVASAAETARTEGGPPTRLRYIVGSALGSLTRLRRGGVDAEITDGAAINAPAGRAIEPPHPEGHQIDQPIAIAGRPSINEPPSSKPDLGAVAHLCTQLGRVDNADDAQSLLQQVAAILDATGLIVWVWDGSAAVLRPALVHGYSDKVVAQLPLVRRDSDNATAAAFRSARTCAIDGGEHASGALVVPLLTPAGCSGVLALELQHGAERTPWVRAVATIFAALLAQLARRTARRGSTAGTGPS